LKPYVILSCRQSIQGQIKNEKLGTLRKTGEEHVMVYPRESCANALHVFKTGNYYQ